MFTLWPRICIGVAAVALPCAGVLAQVRTVTVTAVNRDYLELPVQALVTPPSPHVGVRVTASSREVPAQARASGSKLAVAWVVRNLRRGESRTYRMTFGPRKRIAPTVEVRAVGPGGKDLDILLGGALFARYDVTTGPNKPYFFPVYAPGQKRIVRGYPVAPEEGETRDHIHQRGLWFTHGAVNGSDFWSENPAKTVHTGYGPVSSGPVYGAFVAHTDWIGKDGTKIGEDTREVIAYDLDCGRVMDITITIKPVGAPLVFGDTKEGSFGIRLRDTMKLKGGDGSIVNSEGARDGETWGKRAAWVDYYGTVEGKTVGLAILESPSSFRHPTHWHVRDYGLFAANPFGIHDFESGKPATAGEHTVPLGGLLTLRYRLLFHQGTAEQAQVAQRWAEYADPPKLTIK